MPTAAPRDRSAYWKARWAAARRAVRPTTCAYCGKAVEQPRTSVRRYCDATCRSRAFYASHPGYGWVPGVPLEPMPMPYTGHEVFTAAREAARQTLNTEYASDWGQNDAMGEATLAILEGRDPEAAVRKFRAAEKAIDRSRRWFADIGTDGEGHLWAVRDLDAEGA